jgi:hypothetical protein
LHLAFKRQVAAKQAEHYASKFNMSCFEISPLCDFNIRESFCELARLALHRNGMERIWRSNKGNQSPTHAIEKRLLIMFFFSLSFIFTRIVLSCNSKTDKECLYHRHSPPSTDSQITLKKLRIDNNNMSEQFSE